MYVKVGSETYECYINIRHIRNFGKYCPNSNGPTLASTSRTQPSYPSLVPPGPQWEYWISMDSPHGDGRMILNEDDYNKIVKALQSGGEAYLYGD